MKLDLLLGFLVVLLKVIIVILFVGFFLIEGFLFLLYFRLLMLGGSVMCGVNIDKSILYV